MKTTENCYIINRDSTAAAQIDIPNYGICNMDGISIYDIKKEQIFCGKVTYKNKKKKYEDIDIVNKIEHDNIFLYHSYRDINWRHFIRETFCSLRYFYEQKNKMPDLKILIPELHSKHVKEVIEIMDLQNDVIILKKYNEVFAKKLIVPNVHIDFNFVNKFIEKCKSKSTLNITDNMKNLFFSRKHLNVKRPIANYNDFEEICIKNNNNIYPFIPEELHLEDQITLINNADKIVTLIGACCENIVFTQSKCKFIIICSGITHWWAKQYKEKFYNGQRKCIVSNTGKIDKKTKKGSTEKTNHPWLININKIKKYF